MKRTAPRRNSAFTLIELLVVIAIIGILAAALFPAVSGAILRAQATAFSNRGRNIVMAVINANLERERNMLGVLWPHNRDGDANYPAIALSNEPHEWVQNMLLPAGGRPPRLEGMDLSTFAGGGVPAPPGESVGPGNVAWGMVFNLTESDSENALFLVTRNTEFEFVADQVGDRNYMRVNPQSIVNVNPQAVPFGDKMVVFVRKGGSADSIRPDLLAEAVLPPPAGEGRDAVFVPRGAMNENTELKYPN